MFLLQHFFVLTLLNCFFESVFVYTSIYPTNTFNLTTFDQTTFNLNLNPFESERASVKLVLVDFTVGSSILDRVSFDCFAHCTYFTDSTDTSSTEHFNLCDCSSADYTQTMLPNPKKLLQLKQAKKRQAWLNQEASGPVNLVVSVQ
jgi:hypothetical protein